MCNYTQPHDIIKLIKNNLLTDAKLSTTFKLQHRLLFNLVLFYFPSRPVNPRTYKGNNMEMLEKEASCQIWFHEVTLPQFSGLRHIILYPHHHQNP